MSLRRLSPFALVLPLAAAGGFALLPANPEDANARLAVAQVEPVQPSYLAVPIATVDPLPVRTAEKPAPARPSLTVTTASLAAPVVAPEFPAAPETAAEPKELAHVGSSALNVRAGPSSSTAKLFVLQPGTQVATAESDGSWVRIVTSDGQEGWVFRRYLSTGAAAQEPAVTEARAEARDAVTEARPQQRTARIAGRVPLRAAPSGRSERLFVLEPGERVVIAEQRGRWARVIVDGGISGWVRLN